MKVPRRLVLWLVLKVPKRLVLWCQRVSTKVWKFAAEKGRAQGEGSIPVWETCGTVNEGRWKSNGRKQVRDTKRKHL